MRVILTIISAVFVVGAVASDDETIAKWEERPFFARKAGQKVPPPAFFATTKAMPAGAEVRIKVAQCPKDVTLDIHRFLGGPVYSVGAKKYAELSANKTLTHTLEKEMKVAITANAGGEQGRCKGIKREDGYERPALLLRQARRSGHRSQGGRKVVFNRAVGKSR